MTVKSFQNYSVTDKAGVKIFQAIKGGGKDEDMQQQLYLCP